MIRLILAVLLCSCAGSDRPGTAVGNPGDMDTEARVADPAITLDVVTVPIAAIVLSDCAGTTASIAVDQDLDGLGVSDPPVPLPGGPWCSMQVDLQGPVRALGRTDEDTAFDVAISLFQVTVSGGIDIDGDALVLVLDLPLRAAVLDEIGGDVVVLEGDDQALLWSEDLLDQVSVWRDVDRDGRAAGPDRRLGDSAAFASESASAAGAAGCGCSTRGGPGWGLLLWIGWATRRRRLT